MMALMILRIGASSGNTSAATVSAVAKRLAHDRIRRIQIFQGDGEGGAGGGVEVSGVDGASDGGAEGGEGSGGVPGTGTGGGVGIGGLGATTGSFGV